MPEPARASVPDTQPMLAVRDLNAWYGESHVLHGVSFDVRRGEVVTLLGRNGAGKTTTLKAVMGILAQRKSSVTLQGRELIGLPARAIARHLAGSQAKFAERMNARARALGCTGSHFVNPHGLTDARHYTTARDLGRIMRHAMQLPEFRAITGTQRYRSFSTHAVRLL